MSGFEGISRRLSNELHAKFLAPKEAAKTEQAKEVKPTVPVGKTETKEIGRDFLDSPYAGLININAVDAEDKNDLNKLYTLAGMGTIPTAAQYKSVDKGLTALNNTFDGIKETNSKASLEKLLQPGQNFIYDNFRSEFA